MAEFWRKDASPVGCCWLRLHEKSCSFNGFFSCGVLKVRESYVVSFVVESSHGSCWAIPMFNQPWQLVDESMNRKHCWLTANYHFRSLCIHVWNENNFIQFLSVKQQVITYQIQPETTRKVTKHHPKLLL